MSAWLTTEEAAAHCRYASRSGFLDATKRDGLRPDGQRGRAYLWLAESLNAWLKICADRSFGGSSQTDPPEAQSMTGESNGKCNENRSGDHPPKRWTDESARNGQMPEDGQATASRAHAETGSDDRGCAPDARRPERVAPSPRRPEQRICDHYTGRLRRSVDRTKK